MNYDIKDFGAVGDGKTLNTAAFQSAIDKCSTAGGGSVIVSGGIYKTGSIFLKDNVDLHIEANARILGSENCGKYKETEPNEVHDLVAETESYGDYSDEGIKHIDRKLAPRHRASALIVADEVKNISITGKGVIDANGESFIEKVPGNEKYWMPYKRIDAPTPPRVVLFTGCENVLVKDVTMTNQPAGWSYWVHDCDYVSFDRVKIIAKVEFPNNDGIHINCSRNVTVSNSDISCGDDCLIIRANSISLKENKVCEKVTVTNCNLTSHSGGIRVGWINDGIIRNCTFSNLVMTDTTVGISVFIPDSAESDFGRESTLIENLSFSNIIMDRTYSYPVFISLSSAEGVNIEAVRNLYFENVHSRGCRLPKLVGRKQNPLFNIRFNGCTFEADMSKADDGMPHGAICGDAPLMPSLELTEVSSVEVNNTQFIVH